VARRISQPYRCQPLAGLARQLLFAPPDKRAEQIRRAEKLHDQIDPSVAYPFEFLSYRITGYRSEAEVESLLVGEAIRPDLRLLIDTLSRSVRLPAVKGELFETPEDLASRAGVSTKTVARWRQAGLRWRWVYDRKSKQRRLLLPRDAADRFLADNKDKAARAARYTHLAPGDKARLLARARRLAESRDVTLNQVATHLARRSGRAIETVRILLERHDAANPGRAIFIDRGGPLTARQKRVILRAHRMGVANRKIARHFKRTRTTIHRVIQESRAAEIRRREIRYIMSPTFVREDADQVILEAPDPPDPPHKSPPRIPTDNLPEALRPIFDEPEWAAERQRRMVARYNYLKYKADRTRRALDRHEPRVADMDHAEAWLKQARAIRAGLIASSQRLVLSVIRRHLLGQDDRSIHALLELLEISQDVLRAAVEDFDVSRGQAFDAHVTWHLMRHFATQPGSRGKARRRAGAEEVLRKVRSPD
jgi:hypothetical protein